MKLNRMQIRRLVESVLNEATQSPFDLREKVKDNVMNVLAKKFGVEVDQLETPEFQLKFGHYDWNRKKMSSDLLTRGDLAKDDIPVMWIVVSPPYMLRPDLEDVIKKQIQESEIRSLIHTMNKPGGTVDPERTGYELAETNEPRVRLKGGYPKKSITILYLKKV